MHQKDIERFAFLYLCGQRDKNLLCGTARMTFQDFDRLVYIADVLGFAQMSLEIWNRFSPQFKRQLDAMEKFFKENYGDMEFREDIEDTQIHDKWFEKFCESAPDDEARRLLTEIFDISCDEE